MNFKKNDIVENAPGIEEIQPTRPTIRKENERLRVHAREGIDESTKTGTEIKRAI